jgi:hemolysin III
MFTASATYHLSKATPATTARLRQLDHAGIYALIAGTYVPVSLLGLPGRSGVVLLSGVTIGCIAGVVMKSASFENAHLVGHVLYLTMGLAGVLALPSLARNLSGPELSLLLGGGAFYVCGFPVLVLGRPNPFPTTFGYHELWHLFTVAGASCHFVLVVQLAR